MQLPYNRGKIPQVNTTKKKSNKTQNHEWITNFDDANQWVPIDPSKDNRLLPML